MALYKAIQQGGRPRRLLTMFGDDGKRSKSHNLPPEVIAAQAEALAIPSQVGSASWDDYEKIFLGYLGGLKKDGLGDGIFGDIDLVPHRQWVEKVCGEHDIIAHLPLWQEERRKLLADFIEAGFKAVIVVVDEKRLGSSFLGRVLDWRTIDDLEAAGADACGEEGEYHTLVTGGPIFGRDLRVDYGKISHHKGYGFLDVSV